MAKNDCIVFIGARISEGSRSSTAVITSIESKEVVFCKDCKFWERGHISHEGLARCITGESGLRYRKQNDFCSVGRRRKT